MIDEHISMYIIIKWKKDLFKKYNLKCVVCICFQIILYFKIKYCSAEFKTKMFELYYKIQVGGIKHTLHMLSPVLNGNWATSCCGAASLKREYDSL